jgi:hypothetical protein
MEGGMRISVRFSVDIPDLPGLDHAAIQQWLEFSLGATGQLRESPISDMDLEACRHSVSFSRCD